MPPHLMPCLLARITDMRAGRPHCHPHTPVPHTRAQTHARTHAQVRLRRALLVFDVVLTRILPAPEAAWASNQRVGPGL